ncbi:c-type cytochrome [Photobacterium sp. 1_MG-2023]|uniref:c-type cytochrome n=1 Tax=Photobacterium sp. 1_MG-2023 TaxID=3062646 RepID=UPI0026E32410|nr:c-type cytochrome [Photobacterium sp. 1_MG-2023]MDO6706953.1 c-type cytochrome [Photobacterium sp. 1_MG-2023]
MTMASLCERVIPLSFLLNVWVCLPLSANESLISAGEAQGLVCKACHQLEAEGVVVVGPPLWGLADRPIASFDGFQYSDALKQQQGKWNADKLDAFITSPEDFAPGTNMLFPGVKDPGARAAIIAWLATKNPSPPDWSTPFAGEPVKSPGEDILAPGENMTLVATACSACHSLHLVTQQALSQERWDELLVWMVEEQGMAEPEPSDREAILTYLSTYYGS